MAEWTEERHKRLSGAIDASQKISDDSIILVMGLRGDTLALDSLDGTVTMGDLRGAIAYIEDLESRIESAEYVGP